MWLIVFLYSSWFLSRYHFMIMIVFFFFFKQKTAYEMRISDWSSDVCSSDLCFELRRTGRVQCRERLIQDPQRRRIGQVQACQRDAAPLPEIGRASCRERVCQYV